MVSQVNIWALEKDQNIKHLLLLLLTEFEADSFVIDIETQTHHCAIYLQHKNYERFRAYLFTVGQEQERYGVHLEFPLADSDTNLLESYENLSYKNLVEILSVHLDLV